MSSRPSRQWPKFPIFSNLQADPGFRLIESDLTVGSIHLQEILHETCQAN